MESQDLRIFKAVAELQSISKAADRLDYVQSNISQRIKNLEDELGAPLFSRNNRGVTLTEEGSRLLDYTDQILGLMEEARSSVNPAKWKTTLAIGAPQTLSAVRIPRLLSSFLQDNRIDIRLKTDRAERLQEMLQYGEVEGIFVNGTFNNVLFTPVYAYDERVVVISSKPDDHSKELPGHHLIINSDPNCVYRRKLLDDYMKKKESINRTVMEFDSLEAILQAVKDGLGISVIPADVAYSRKELQSVQMEELPDPVRVSFIVKQGRKQSRPLKQFIRFLADNGLQPVDSQLAP
ncbi:LysR family transcriptional regulator [Paenibacillus typhae]|uniref:DNA-binding transcriptional regulator, LysR family n=1 Tax=Paenibacillus typhae TaxID=1174501 RepID=A0A1G9AE53_9BACL|nr:LysR family transcriptional regulator [Paenibacillus typhae]SDK25616.1 DNA-binding transcriptional regulator, LysR family [Paenibacillus typhae]